MYQNCSVPWVTGQQGACSHETFTGRAHTYENPKIRKSQFSHSTQLLELPLHSPLSQARGNSSTSLSASPCSSPWSVCSPAAVWGGWGVTRSASATPSAPPASGPTCTGPRTDTGPAPGTYSADTCLAEQMLEGWNSNWTEDKRSLAVSGNCSASSDPSKHQRLKEWETLGPVFHLFILVDCEHHFN